MGFFWKSKKKEENTKLDFAQIDSNEKAMELAQRKILAPLYLMPLQFGGEESPLNRIFVPPVVVEIKDRCDKIIEGLLIEEKVNQYSCTPEYKGDSFIPSAIIIAATMDDQPVFTQTVTIWE